MIANSKPITTTDWIKWLVPLGICLILLLFRLSDIAGIHRDEATFAIFAESILQGARPVRGYFNNYTSPVHSYIIALFFLIFGKSIWSLRISGVFFNIIAVIAYTDIIRRIAPRAAIWALWLLVTFPSFVVFSRIAGENYALNFFFFIGGIWCYYVPGNNSRQLISITGCIASGLLFYLGIWNHIVFLPASMGIMCVYFILANPGWNKLRQAIPLMFLGGLIGMIPKLYGVLALGYPFFADTSRELVPPLLRAIRNMVYTLGGDALFMRACGEVLFSLKFLLPLAVLGSFFILLFKDENRMKKIWLACFSCFALSFLGTWLITPVGLIGSRLWLLPLIILPAVLSVPLVLLKRKARYLVGVLLILLNLFNIGINHYYNFSRHKGTPKHKIYVGGRFDNSLDFIDMRPQIEKLRNYNNELIYIEDYNLARLKYLLPSGERHRAHLLKELYAEGYRAPQSSLVAVYRLDNRKYPESRAIGKNILQKKSSLSSHHYIVYQID